MENQNLLHLDNDLTEHEAKFVSSVIDDAVVLEDIKHDHENNIDDLILIPDKVTNTEKQPQLENSFEVIDQETKSIIIDDMQENTDVTNISKDEEENVSENDLISSIKIEDIESIPKIPEFPKKEEPVPLEKLESKIADTTKTATNQEIEPIKMVYSDVKIPENIITESIFKESPKKDTDEGDVCDIKIGPEELFCRIGLGKIKL